MTELGYPDLHHAQAAEGWLELGDLSEAAQELRLVSAKGLSHPDVLEVQWRLYATRHQWDAALDVARLVTRADPDRPNGWIHTSYSLHELSRTAEAWDLLLPQAERFPEETTIAYNLACYACRLGRGGEARTWIQRAIQLRGKSAIRAMALQDPDLQHLRDYLESL